MVIHSFCGRKPGIA